MRELAHQWIQRLGRPMSAAIVFCALGLFAAVFAVGVNRIVASRPIINLGPGALPTAAASTGSATASVTPQTSCAGAGQARGDLKNFVLAAPVALTLTDGDTSLAVVIPAGAALDGNAEDMHAHLRGASADQPLRGTLVKDADICAQGAGGQQVRVTVHGGAQLDGKGASTAAGVEARDIHIREQGSGDSGD